MPCNPRQVGLSAVAFSALCWSVLPPDFWAKFRRFVDDPYREKLIGTAQSAPTVIYDCNGEVRAWPSSHLMVLSPGFRLPLPSRGGHVPCGTCC